jgi:hypothetical protein
MGAEWAPASIDNDTDNIWLVVVDGNRWGHFITIPPGGYSLKKVESIDGFGAYYGGTSGPPVDVIYDGKLSNWWKIRDGTFCAVQTDASGAVFLVVFRHLAFFGPKRRKASDFGYTPGLSIPDPY